MFKEFLFIALGGAIGACLRSALYLGLGRFESFSLPWGQIAANSIGCFLAGFCLPYLGGMSTHTKAFIVIGFLGSVTTMSAFAFDIHQLLAGEKILSAGLLWTSGSLVSIAMVYVGQYISQAIKL